MLAWVAEVLLKRRAVKGEERCYYTNGAKEWCYTTYNSVSKRSVDVEDMSSVCKDWLQYKNEFVVECFGWASSTSLGGGGGRRGLFGRQEHHMVGNDFVVELVKNGSVVGHEPDESPGDLGQLFLAHLQTNNKM